MKQWVTPKNLSPKFSRVNGGWELDEWKTIWTKAGGSASEFMWPYYR